MGTKQPVVRLIGVGPWNYPEADFWPAIILKCLEKWKPGQRSARRNPASDPPWAPSPNPPSHPGTDARSEAAAKTPHLRRAFIARSVTSRAASMDLQAESGARTALSCRTGLPFPLSRVREGARACSVRTLMSAEPRSSVGRSRSALPVCAKLVGRRCSVVADVVHGRVRWPSRRCPQRTTAAPQNAWRPLPRQN